MALVIDLSRSAAVSREDSETLPESSNAQRYIHYRIYDQDGELTSKTSFDETASSLGRISVLSLPPPHTATSLKRRLRQVEGIPGQDFQIFRDDEGEMTMDDGDALTLQADSYPGAAKDEPIAVVYGAQKKINEEQVSEFPKRVTATSGFTSFDPKWHTMETGDTFQTDGVMKIEQYNYTSGCTCYVGMNSGGILPLSMHLA